MKWWWRNRSVEPVLVCSLGCGILWCLVRWRITFPSILWFPGVEAPVAMVASALVPVVAIGRSLARRDALLEDMAVRRTEILDTALVLSAAILAAVPPVSLGVFLVGPARVIATSGFLTLVSAQVPGLRRAPSVPAVAWTLVSLLAGRGHFHMRFWAWQFHDESSDVAWGWFFALAVLWVIVARFRYSRGGLR